MGPRRAFADGPIMRPPSYSISARGSPRPRCSSKSPAASASLVCSLSQALSRRSSLFFSFGLVNGLASTEVGSNRCTGCRGPPAESGQSRTAQGRCFVVDLDGAGRAARSIIEAVFQALNANGQTGQHDLAARAGGEEDSRCALVSINALP